MKISGVHLVGTTFNDSNVVNIAAEAVRLAQGDETYDYSSFFEATPEPTNQHDPNAIKITYCDDLLGYVNATAARSIKELMERKNYSTIVVDKIDVYGGYADGKKLTGFWADFIVS